MLEQDPKYPNEDYDDTLIQISTVPILNAGVIVEVVPRNMRRVYILLLAVNGLTVFSPVPGILLLPNALGGTQGLLSGALGPINFTKYLHGDAARCAWFGIVPSGQDVIDVLEVLHK